MMEQPSFGVLLARLLQHRGVNLSKLARAAPVPETELRTVLTGAVPSPSLLRRLAPALKLHTADLFVVAELPVPADLAPVEAISGSLIKELVRCAINLRPEQRHRLRQLAQSLPRRDRVEQELTLPVYEQYEPSFGATVVRMLRNRNLDWSTSTQILYNLAGVGPLSAATIGAVGHGRKELSPELLVGFATVLAIPADDLAAMAGVELTPEIPRPHAAGADLAGLIWDIRRLTTDQVRHVCEAAKSELAG
ncbi:XRE family transcriptional regulator [Micromonospora sp. STR1_7]|uniref:XRE family transcriptional regulator n=1 Tax=Micromonospora parastrephiae TaxID=2806101 RepID=A0ABS1Y251_9ACTN|nr:XRE family transcriptional regulator [Micromonospora parastrephiae]MBM0235589.1 XRE family transcriptional regulator [Micromonospora parastrephiae]